MSAKNQTTDSANGDKVAGTSFNPRMNPRESSASPMKSGDTRPSGENADQGNRNRKS